jgi:hypothetical protein
MNLQVHFKFQFPSLALLEIFLLKQIQKVSETFSIDFPKGDVQINTKYQMHVKMNTRKKMTNFFGLIGISSKIPLTIYPIPLYEKLKISDELYNYQDKDSKYKLYQMYLRFTKNCYEPGTKQKIVIKYRNPTV